MIPAEVMKELAEALEGLRFGSVKLVVKAHDGKLNFRIRKKVTIVPGKRTTGG